MTRADNTCHLLRAAAARHDRAIGRARAAIDEFDRATQSPTFAAVARAAGVSRSWLYDQPDIRDAIIRLRRERPTETSVPSVQRTSPASLRQRLDESRTEIARLRAENGVLRDQLARRLGEDRARR
ncbi:MAG: DUF6262 family protein [Actinobacteria bacterium]|nr:DUF6262 family protein [Actinomycetota bacterium]